MIKKNLDMQPRIKDVFNDLWQEEPTSVSSSITDLTVPLEPQAKKGVQLQKLIKVWEGLWYSQETKAHQGAQRKKLGHTTLESGSTQDQHPR